MVAGRGGGGIIVVFALVVIAFFLSYLVASQGLNRTHDNPAIHTLR